MCHNIDPMENRKSNFGFSGHPREEKYIYNVVTLA